MMAPVVATVDISINYDTRWRGFDDNHFAPIWVIGMVWMAVVDVVLDDAGGHEQRGGCNGKEQEWLHVFLGIRNLGDRWLPDRAIKDQRFGKYDASICK
jgi:hypothetical protein